MLTERFEAENGTWEEVTYDDKGRVVKIVDYRGVIQLFDPQPTTIDIGGASNATDYCLPKST